LSTRVVITGIGLLTPLGLDKTSTWSGVVEGKSGVARITRFDAEAAGMACTIAGEVKGFDPEPFINRKDARKMDTFIQYGVAAATMALDDSGLEISEANADRVGVIIGSGIGGLPAIEATLAAYQKGGARKISPFFIPKTIINMISGWASMLLGAKGPNSATVTACATGTHAIGEAWRIIASGEADAMLAGGSESCICVLGVGGFCASKALSTRNDDPQSASRPWDRDRDGFVMGEGSGVLVLESLASAQQRGATIIAEVVGYGMSGDAHHITAPSPGGEGGARCMQSALQSANLTIDSVNYINAHGTSTPAGDLAETEGIKRVFGEQASKLMVTSNKSMIGHLLGAAGGVEAALTALSIQKGIATPTINMESPGEGCDLDYVANEARDADINVAISNSFGFGGTNASVVLKKFK